MTDKDLFEKRVVPAFNELYKEATNAFGRKLIIEWNDIEKLVVNHDGKNVFPWDAFYVSREDFNRIIKKACSKLKHFWRWPYKSQIIYDDKTIKDFKKKLKKLDKESFEYQNLSQKIKYNPIYKQREDLWAQYRKDLDELGDNITKAQRDKLAKKYNMQWYSRDAEKVTFTLTLGLPVPTSNKEFVDKLATLYAKMQKADPMDDKQLQTFLACDDREFETLKLMQEFIKKYDALHE